MKARHLLMLIGLAALVAFQLPRVGAQDAPAGDQPPPAAQKPPANQGVSIMTAEQGDELQRKVDKLLEDQKKLLEKIDQMQKDIEFVKAASRAR